MITISSPPKILLMVAFLWLPCLLACQNRVRDRDGEPLTDIASTAVGVYMGTLHIGGDSFPDILIQLWVEGEDRIRVGSGSDLVRPFACEEEEDRGLLIQSDAGKDYFMSVALDPGQAAHFLPRVGYWCLDKANTSDPSLGLDQQIFVTKSSLLSSLALLGTFSLDLQANSIGITEKLAL
jgi:hypothetical protein